jgi:hypothetical protein
MATASKHAKIALLRMKFSPILSANSSRSRYYTKPMRKRQATLHKNVVNFLEIMLVPKDLLGIFVSDTHPGCQIQIQ